MPTLFREKGFRFLFYSNERHEPCHIHVIGRGGEAKLWIPECKFAFAYRFTGRDLKDILETVENKAKIIEERWNEFFKSSQ